VETESVRTFSKHPCPTQKSIQLMNDAKIASEKNAKRPGAMAKKKSDRQL
jgi:hypothetical protein